MFEERDIPFLRSALPFWGELTPAQQQMLMDQGRRLHYPAGRAVHNGMEDCIGVILVRSGELRAYILSEEGKEVTLYRLFEGDVCILSAACIMQNITFDVYMDAVRDSEIFLISPTVFEELRAQCPAVEAFVSSLISARFSEVMWVMEQILFMSFDRRLAIFLLDESARTGADTLEMTHETIARHMGSAREVVSRMLKYFATEGLVRLSRGGVTLLDKARLRAMAR